MTTLTLPRRSRMLPVRTARRARRGANLLEFVITLPLAFVVILIGINMNHLYGMATTTREAAFAAARQAGQTGEYDDERAEVTVREVIKVYPGGHAVTFPADTVSTVPGMGVCQKFTGGGSAGQYIKTRVTVQTPMLIKGLGGLVPGIGEPKITLTGYGLARCEIAKQ